MLGSGGTCVFARERLGPALFLAFAGYARITTPGDTLRRRTRRPA